MGLREVIDFGLKATTSKRKKLYKSREGLGGKRIKLEVKTDQKHSPIFVLLMSEKLLEIL